MRVFFIEESYRPTPDISWDREKNRNFLCPFFQKPPGRLRWLHGMASPLFELARVLVRFDHVARFIVKESHSQLRLCLFFEERFQLCRFIVQTRPRPGSMSYSVLPFQFINHRITILFIQYSKRKIIFLQQPY